MRNQDQFFEECINEQRRSFLKYTSAGFAGSYLILNSAYGITSLAAKIPELSVLDFGAKGDGLNDDSFAFQQACDVAAKFGGARVHLPDPDKYYRLLFPVYLSDNTEVFGQGENTRIIFEDPLFVKGRGGFVIGSSQEANREYARKRYLNKQNVSTINPDFKNPEQRQYLRDNPRFLQAENSIIHDLYIEAKFTRENINNWGGYGINFVNARNCHAYNVWGRGWTQLIGMGSDVPPETPSNHNCSARNLHVISPDLKRTYYSIGFIANSTSCVIENAQQHSPMTAGSLNGSGIATNLCEDCIIKNIKIPDLGKTVTSEGVLINNSSGCLVENILIGNARTAVSVFYNDAKTLNPVKPNYFSNIKGVNCEVVLAVYSKFNVIRYVSSVNSTHNILLKNSNATNNYIYSPPESVTASKNLSQRFLSVHKFITSQLR
ncbi:glycosyl hydrolase family 28-related protein [Rahnella bruchi]|uniref:glycosyl hydrolase family 28-related protein n=1 Tax=Rahnella bruchi TaxID=1510573 RepID=UPI000EA2D087|nr:glycosyl hydrolase family 28-related protein [Rahnella bruchi]